MPKLKSKKPRKTRKIVPAGSTVLDEKQEKFCQHYVYGDLGNATQAYAAAYEIDITEVNSPSYTVAKTSGCRLLTKVYIRERLTKLLNDLLSDDQVDAELAKVIRQDTELSSKVSAIKEYNRVRMRVKDTPGVNIINVTDSQIAIIAGRAASTSRGNE